MNDRLDVAVVGAGSFVGGALTSALTRHGHRPHAYTRDDFDVVDHDSRFDGRADVVVFLAQDRSYGSLDTGALRVFDVNTVGVLNAAIKATQAGARGFVYTSTGNVYAPSFESLTEDHPVARSDIYSTSKIFAEQILELTEGDLHVCRPRLFGAYGPNQSIGLLAGLTNRIRRGDPVTMTPRFEGVADGGFTASLTHVDDIADALVELCELAVRGSAPPVLNVAAPRPTTIEALAKQIGRALGVEPRLELTAGTRDFDLIADTSAARRLLTTEFRSTADGVPASVSA